MRTAGGEEKHTSIRGILMLALPMSFDLAATVLMSVGLLYVTASIYQMLRGAEILFSALFAVVFLHRKLNRLHYLGIATCTAGIVIVGASSLLGGSKDEESNDASSDASKVLLGMLLIVIAQARPTAVQIAMRARQEVKGVGIAPDPYSSWLARAVRLHKAGATPIRVFCSEAACQGASLSFVKCLLPVD